VRFQDGSSPKVRGQNRPRAGAEKGGIFDRFWSVLGHYQAKNGQKGAKIGVLLLLNS
jgi:hypothetical protein